MCILNIQWSFQGFRLSIHLWYNYGSINVSAIQYFVIKNMKKDDDDDDDDDDNNK